jgi:hypothetical protein
MIYKIIIFNWILIYIDADIDRYNIQVGSSSV